MDGPDANTLMTQHPIGYTYDDIIIIPGHSDFGMERVDLSTKLTKNWKMPKTKVKSTNAEARAHCARIPEKLANILSETEKLTWKRRTASSKKDQLRCLDGPGGRETTKLTTNA